MSQYWMRCKKISAFALDILFPRRCPWCAKVVGFGAPCTCIEELCTGLSSYNLKANGQIDTYLSEMYVYCWYKDGAKEAVHNLKFQQNKQLALPMGQRMAVHLQEFNAEKKYDILVSVPISPKTLKRRGYNQSALLAREISNVLSLPVHAGLIKTKETQHQMDLTRAERLLNVVGAYKAKGLQVLQGKRVLLVDDVLTTGGTLNECARTLLKAGAASVAGLCFAATPPPKSSL